MPRFFRAALLCLCLPGAATAQRSDLVWDRVPGGTDLRLFHGLPESDFALLLLDCRTGADGALVSGQFEAAIGDGADGTPRLVEFEGLGEGLPVISGRIVGRDREVGSRGFAYEAPPGDRLWRHVATADPLRWSLRGVEGTTEIRGAPEGLVTDFLEACAATRAEGSAPAAPGAQAAATPRPCSDRGTLRSAPGGAGIDVRVDNLSGADREVIWIDGSGVEVPLGTLPAGQWATLGTEDGAAWLFTDGGGTCTEMFAATAGARFALGSGGADGTGGGPGTAAGAAVPTAAAPEPPRDTK